MMFKSPLIICASTGTGVIAPAIGAAEAQFQTANHLCLDHIAPANGRRPPPVQTGFGYGARLGRAEQPECGLFTGADGVDACGRPDNNDQTCNQDYGEPYSTATQPTRDSA